MLALNVVLGRGELPATVVFDEVDAGIGGRAAGVVGDRLGRLTEERQVLCVTHLPQIASRAHAHWHVAKHEKGGRTLVSVARLEGETRVDELARMLAGREITESARRHARELLGESATVPARSDKGSTAGTRPGRTRRTEKWRSA
jgi:DNA repair protein RecN (Recombination protein N)